MSESFAINRDHRDGVEIVQVVGSLDTVTALPFRTSCLEALSAATMGLVIDISEVDFVASSGIGTFMLINESGRKSGCKVVIIGASEAVLDVLCLMNLDQFLNLQVDLKSALSNLEKEPAAH